jgi:toxin ParE1/3/4
VAGFVLASDADADLQSIYWFTHERWGENQAEQYIDGLFSTFETLAQYPELGRSRPELNAKVRSFAHKRHVIYYMALAGEIGISRVLHGSMDVENAGIFAE